MLHSLLLFLLTSSLQLSMLLLHLSNILLKKLLPENLLAYSRTLREK